MGGKANPERRVQELFVLLIATMKGTCPAKLTDFENDVTNSVLERQVTPLHTAQVVRKERKVVFFEEQAPAA